MFWSKLYARALKIITRVPDNTLCSSFPLYFRLKHRLWSLRVRNSRCLSRLWSKEYNMTHRKSSAKLVKSLFLSCRSAIRTRSRVTTCNLLRAVYKEISALQLLKETRTSSECWSSSRIWDQPLFMRYQRSSCRVKIRSKIYLAWVIIYNSHKLAIYRSLYMRHTPRRWGHRLKQISHLVIITQPCRRNFEVLKKFFKLVSPKKMGKGNFFLHGENSRPCKKKNGFDPLD